MIVFARDDILLDYCGTTGKLALGEAESSCPFAFYRKWSSLSVTNEHEVCPRVLRKIFVRSTRMTMWWGTQRRLRGYEEFIWSLTARYRTIWLQVDSPPHRAQHRRLGIRLTSYRPFHPSFQLAIEGGKQIFRAVKRHRRHSYQHVRPRCAFCAGLARLGQTGGRRLLLRRTRPERGLRSAQIA